MATYPVVNTKTGEQKEVVMSIMGVGSMERGQSRLDKGLLRSIHSSRRRRSWGSGKINSTTNIQAGVRF